MSLSRTSNSTAPAQWADLVVNLLASPASYPEPTRDVVQVETHISRVFLTDRFAYKLKKPVSYDFLDFSSSEKRRWACEQEVRLNRRLADDVYLGVIPITREGRGRLKLAGGGEPIDWVVKMRRLPAGRALDQLIGAGVVGDGETNELASRLAQFYQQLPPLNINVELYRSRIEDHIRGNELVLGKSEFVVERAMLKRIHAAQIRMLRLAPEILNARVCDGRIVDGHGDLRPEHVYFDPHPTIIDCIEFNDEFRQLDVLDELAFLAAECEHLGAAQVGERIIDEYRTTSNDLFPQTLLEFYKCYRACVRAKVLLLRASQVARHEQGELRSDARSYLQLADRHASKLGPPVLLVVYGLSGTGKSTLSRRIAERLEVDLLSTDAIRREMLELGGQELRAENLYHPKNRQRVYEEMFRRAKLLLGDRLSVVLDGTFHSATIREEAVDLARQIGAEPHLIHCQCPPDVTIERIKSRNLNGDSLSDATPEVYRRQHQVFESDPPRLPVHFVDTNRNATDVLQAVVLQLRSWMLRQ